MDWIDLLDLQQPQQNRQLSILRKWKRFTLYDHNSAVNFNEDQQTFTCVFNSKKINSQHSIIGKIHGSLKTNTITIINTLTDHEVLLGGKWQYQKIELTRFAFRYNKRSHNNIVIKVNPINGQVAVCMSFSITPGLFQSEQRFREIMTDCCQSLGDESEKIFNTMMEIIYQRQSNQPYLKSGIKVNPNFPRYMKVQKLLDKVKSLISTSSFYKIRVDTSSAHRNRSYFKKLYLITDKKFIKDEEIQKMALVFELKYNKVYEEQAKNKQREKGKEYIKDYTELEEKNQVEFAKHLNENQVYDYPAFVKLSITEVQDAMLESHQNSQAKKIIKTSIKEELKVLVDKVDQSQTKHTIHVLNRLKFNHPNITKYYIDQKQPQVRITQGFDSLTLQQFLSRNKHIISLSTKFDIMFQLCHAIQFMHKNMVGCFVRPGDVIVDRGGKVMIRNLAYTYCVRTEVGWKDVTRQKQQKDSFGEMDFQRQGGKFFMEKDQPTIKLDLDYQERNIEFPYINIASALDDLRTDPKRGLQNQKCDIFSLGIVLYRILIDKYPFNIDSILLQIPKMNIDDYNRTWKKLWTVQTEYYLTQGGQIAKLVTHLLLKCFNSVDIVSRPYVEWLTVILSEIKTSLNGLY